MSSQDGASQKTIVQEPGAQPAPVLPRLRALLPSLPASDRRVAEAVLAEPDQVVYQSISELAEAAGTSPSTVVRCAQRLELRGFHDLKLALAQERALLGGDVAHADHDESPSATLRSVIEAGAQSVRDSLTTVGESEFKRAAEALNEARRILFVGVGTSAPLAQDAGYRFKAIGLEAEAPPDVHVQHVSAGRLEAGDVCFAISHTGSTRETNACVDAARSAGASTLAITSFSRSPLTELAETILVAGTREVSFRLEAMASRLAHFAVLDAVLVAVAHADQARSEAALELYTQTLAEHRL